MISGNFSHCNTLIEFNTEIIALHERTHGEGYCDVHRAIRRLVPGKRYVECGINQGATLSTAALSNPKSITGYDTKLKSFLAYEHLFRVDFEFMVKELSSVHPTAPIDCDVLFLDTVHKPAFLYTEMSVWFQHVKEAIIVHGTNAKPLRKVIDIFARYNKEWEVTHHTVNVGYSILRKTGK